MSKKYRIQLLPAARKDLFGMGAYIATDSCEAAIRYLDKIHSKIQLLSSHPRMGHRPKDPYLKKRGYRVLVVDSYLVFYVIQRTAIKIRRIIHGSKDLKSILFH